MSQKGKLHNFTKCKKLRSGHKSGDIKGWEYKTKHMLSLGEICMLETNLFVPMSNKCHRYTQILYFFNFSHLRTWELRFILCGSLSDQKLAGVEYLINQNWKTPICWPEKNISAKKNVRELLFQSNSKKAKFIDWNTFMKLTILS